MTLSQYDDDGTQEDDPNLFRILISSDVHLGYAEKDPERCNDSFNSFDELLGIGADHGVDMVLLGGDLFHENKPSRRAEIKCIEILRKHVLGDNPVQIEYLSDPLVDFAHCQNKMVNYESQDLNIGLPVFSIHGNHDDPSGLGATSCMDLMHESGYVNYFGKVTDLKDIKVRPLLLRKGTVKVALYGLSHVKDERLHRLFRDNKVTFETPEDCDDWFNILVLHQNRAKRGPTNYIPEQFLPTFMHIILWGHEHDCRLKPEFSESSLQDFYITQPGSPVATSLCEGEAIDKYVGILNIRADRRFKMDEIKLQTVRPLIFKTISVLDFKNIDLKQEDVKQLSEEVETKLKYEVEEMISQADDKLTGHPNQGTKPLLRLRVEYTDESQQLNPARFGNAFLERVANAHDILLFKKKLVERKIKTENGEMIVAMGDVDEESQITMEEIIKDYFDNAEEEKKLEILDVNDFGNMVKLFVDKDDKEALKRGIDSALDKTFETLMERDDGLEIAMNMKVDKEYVENRMDDNDDGNISMDEEEEEKPKPAATRGRGRGRGARGGATTTARGRGRAASRAVAPATHKVESESPPPKRVSARNASPTKKASSRNSSMMSQSSSRATTQSTLAQSFARSVTRTSTQKNIKKQQFDSDSDDF